MRRRPECWRDRVYHILFLHFSCHCLSQEHKSFVAQERLQATSLFLRKVQKPLAIEYNFTKRDLCEVHYDITTTLSLVLLKGVFTSASKHQSGLLILLLVSRWWKRSCRSYSKEKHDAFPWLQTKLKELDEWHVIMIVSCDQLGETIRAAPSGGGSQ